MAIPVASVECWSIVKSLEKQKINYTVKFNKEKNTHNTLKHTLIIKMIPVYLKMDSDI